MEAAPHSQLDSEGLSRKARAATSPIYERIFLARNESRSRNVSPHTLQAITSATPMSLSTSHLVFGKKKIKFSFTRGKYSQKTEGEGTSHCTHTDSHGLDDASQVQGPRAYSAEEIYVCEESCQFLLVRKDTGTRKPILSTASEK